MLKHHDMNSWYYKKLLANLSSEDKEGPRSDAENVRSKSFTVKCKALLVAIYRTSA